MKKLAPAVIAIVLLVMPDGAAARPHLTLARGRLAITRYEQRFNGTVGRCWRANRLSVLCKISEPAEEQEEPGWTQETELLARLRHNGVIVVEFAAWAPGVLSREWA